MLFEHTYAMGHDQTDRKESCHKNEGYVEMSQTVQSQGNRLAYRI